MTDISAIQSVLAAYRSTDAYITQEQITAAWSAYENAKSVASERQRLADALRCIADETETLSLAVKVAREALKGSEA